jgi:hypothetical protein
MKRGIEKNNVHSLGVGLLVNIQLYCHALVIRYGVWTDNWINAYNL